MLKPKCASALSVCSFASCYRALPRVTRLLRSGSSSVALRSGELRSPRDFLARQRLTKLSMSFRETLTHLDPTAATVQCSPDVIPRLGVDGMCCGEIRVSNRLSKISRSRTSFLACEHATPNLLFPLKGICFPWVGWSSGLQSVVAHRLPEVFVSGA